ncbi:MAG: sensor histidine kinase [Anaerolineae bacterium]
MARARASDAPIWMLSVPVQHVSNILRWISLALAIGLSFVDQSQEGRLVGTLPLAVGLAGYFLARTLVPLLSRLPDRPLLGTALDAIVATIAVYLNGGYHSAFFILYLFVLITVAFYFNVVTSIVLANISGFLYVLACVLSPAGLSAPWAVYLVSTKLVLLLVVALVTSLLLEQLRHEHLQMARERALAEAQATFVSMVSHELRTPLTCIKSSVEMLQALEEQGGLAEERKMLLQTIAGHTARLEGLVNDLLNVTKLEANQVALTLQPTDLAELLRRIALAYHSMLAGKDQALYLELDEELPRIGVDRKGIEQIVGNILSNAHKFSPAGTAITLRLCRRGEEVCISVQDQGPGIPPEEQGRIFDKFYVGRHQRAGVGLGLYIARRLAELHGGRITVESQLGAGSTFTLWLPIHQPEEEKL